MSFPLGSGSTSRNKQYNKNKSKSSFADRELDITKEEFSRIREALDKEEFRKLFFDYIEEIQDPENRKLYEQEIEQFEKERGVQVTFIHPQPGFVVKTSIDGEIKCFINIAVCSEIETPKQEVAVHPETGERGMSWSIPLAQTPARDDLDAKNKRCKVFDVVFHPNALYLSKKNNEFRKCLIDTALDAVEREFHVKLDRTNLKFPKMQFKGMARPTVIRKLNANATPEQMEPHPLDHVSPAKPTAESGKPKVLPMKTKATPKPEFTVPNYVIKHCRDVDLSEHTNELDAKMNATVPRSLVVEIELPLLKSTAECQLDVTSKSIYLLSERAGAKYRLKLDLPYEVDDKEGNARFNTDERCLCITLPVIRSNPSKERELHDALRNLSREDSGVELHSNSESPVEEEEEDEDAELTEEQGKLVHIDDDSANATPAITPMQSPRKFLNDSIHYQFPPKFDCNVLDNVMSFVLHVRNVQSDSIVTLKQSQSLHLQFASIGSGCYPIYYAFYVQLPKETHNGGIELEIESADTEAWENNLILNLNLNANSEKIKNYLAGPDSNDLKEYTIFRKVNLGKGKDRNNTAPLIGDVLNVNVELKNQINSLDIVIKSKGAVGSGFPNCATTDDDDEAAASTHRKQSKKQRKRNKKRRSLSESACDDLKVLAELHQEEVCKQKQEQQHQQKKQQHQQNYEQDQQHHEEKKNVSSDFNDDDSSPERATADTSTSAGEAGTAHFIPKARKQRSYSECHDSSLNGSASIKSILKRYSRYGPRPSISDSCSSMDECNSSSYSRSVDASVHGFSQSFGGIPEEGGRIGDEHDDACLSESCKKTVRFNDQIMKQVFRLDSSILGQRKKNQKRRDRKLRAMQRRLSEGDSADYEETDNQKPNNAEYFKNKNNKKCAQHDDSGLYLGARNEKVGDVKDGQHSTNKMIHKKKLQEQNHQHESDTDHNKNSMMFEMDDDDDDDEDM